MCDTICMILYMAGRILENWGVWYNMYDTIYTTQKSSIYVKMQDITEEDLGARP